MQTQAYFDDIQLHILYELRKATTSIHIAVAWFTDPDIFEQLCQKAGSGVRVELIVVNDSINRKSGIEHEQLRDLGGVFMMVGDKKKSSAIMHNKFCVIDGATVITGSYNWSRQAQQNSENITIISDHPELARQFIQEFESIFERHSGKGVVGADLGKIVARLEAMRHVIDLDDEDDIKLQLGKLKKLLSGGGEHVEVNEIIARIEENQLDQAIAGIETFVRSRKQIAIYIDPDIPELTLELKAMEIQVGALEDEKTELEKLLHIYNYRHAAEVGEIIRRILLLRRDQLEGEAKQDENKKDEYQEARKDYEEYDRDYQETSKKELFKITEAEQQELKAIFRACSKMCHPDVVALEFKGEATKMFAKLSEANEKNDIAAVKTIYEQLQKGIFAPMSATVSDAQKLHKQVVRMRGKVKDLAVAIFTIRSSEAYRKVVAIEDWDEYFARLKEQLQTELDRLEAGAE
jgi:multidrug efflux pump subunit AcrA (membrane-fusion protein)